MLEKTWYRSYHVEGCNHGAEERFPSVHAFRVFLGIGACIKTILSSSSLGTEHFGSLSVYYNEVLQVRPLSTIAENILQFIDCAM